MQKASISTEQFLSSNHEPFVVVWLRRDLRIEDNHALYAALIGHKNVLPLFILDTQILNELDDKVDKRVQFIHNQLQLLNERLVEQGSALLVLHGNPASIFKTLPCKAVYTNSDYEPYARKRDQAIQTILKKRGIDFFEFKDQVVFQKGEILKKDETPYTIFTPYSKQWKLKLTATGIHPYETQPHFKNLYPTKPIAIPTMEAIGFEETRSAFPERTIKLKTIQEYHQNRDYPGVAGTSKLSVHLRFGTVSIRKLVQLAITQNETWLNELIWRDFYQMILWHFPDVEKSFKRQYDKIVWRNNENEFDKWCEGKTGYPLVDAGMRELNETGFMHNRVRMVTASFLTKHLLVDWRWGEAYFAKKLLDFDLAANNGGWQWAAGSGCDAAPYFRVFNPSLQEEKFDPDRVYIKKWIPEIDSSDYPKPIVEHTMARNRAIETYKMALTNT